MSTVLNPLPLSQRLRPLLRGFDWPLLLAVLLLAGAGLVAMYSSGFDQGARFAAHGRNMLMAAAIMFVTAQIPPQRLMRLAVPLYGLGLALLLAVALFGASRKGATRWLDLGLVMVQPSELFKIVMPLVLAWWFHRREGQVRAPDFALAFALLALPVGFIVRQPDLGTALLVLAAGLSVIFFAGLPWKLVLPVLLLGAAGLTLLLVYQDRLCADGVNWRPLLHEYQRQRVCMLLDPMRDPLHRGWHVLQGMIAIGSGGLYGKGFMQGTQTQLAFVPERTTDFIFASFSEEFGLLGNLALIAGFLFLILRAFRIAARGTTLFARLLGAGLATIFFAYAFVNMGMVSGILPVVGVPLPFISYGGTAMVTLGLALGMLLSISRAQTDHARAEIEVMQLRVQK